MRLNLNTKFNEGDFFGTLMQSKNDNLVNHNSPNFI